MKKKEVTNETLQAEIRSLRQQIIKANKRLSNIVPSDVEKYIEKARDDAKEVHDGYRLLILKQCVATEVVFMAKIEHPELAPILSQTIIRAFDESAEWWGEREELTLAEWVKAIVNLAEKYEQRDKDFNIPDLDRVYYI